MPSNLFYKKVSVIQPSVGVLPSALMFAGKCHMGCSGVGWQETWD